MKMVSGKGVSESKESHNQSGNRTVWRIQGRTCEQGRVGQRKEMSKGSVSKLDIHGQGL